jgi:hypothetical protein
MKTQDIIIAHPNSIEQINAIKRFMEKLKIKFEISKAEQSTYNPDFVTKIKQSQKEFEKGDFVRVEQSDLQKMLGLEE